RQEARRRGAGSVLEVSGERVRADGGRGAGAGPRHRGGWVVGDEARPPPQLCSWQAAHRSLVLSVTAAAEGSSAWFQPPPSVWMSKTVAVMRRPRIWTAVTSLASAMVWVVMTFR